MSTTTVTSTPNPSVFGQSVTYTANVTGITAGTPPWGDVTFVIAGGPIIGPVTLNPTGPDSGTFSVTDSTLAVGSHLVTVSFVNSTDPADNSTGTTTQQVNQSATTTTVTFVPPAPVCGETVTLTASVAAVPPGSGTPTGTVTFIISADGPTVTGTLDASGNASVTVSALSVGTHQVAAFYSGDTNFAPSNSPLTPLTVNPASSTTTLTVSPASPVCGETVTLCAQVAVVAPGTCTPTGTVAFAVDGVPFVVAALDASGQACVTNGNIPVGTHTVTATYNGNGNVASSTGTGSVTVGQGASTTTVTVTPAAPVCGAAITICAQVTVPPPSTCTPTGTVTFVITGGPTLTGTLDATGQACVTTSAIPVGSHAVTATYAGDGGVMGSVATSTVTVNQASSTTALTMTPASPVCGQSVTLCAQVSTTSPGTCAPTGMVTFAIVGGPTLTGTLNASGQACVTTGVIPVGTHAVTVTYGGSTGVAGSSASGSVTVGQANTTTTLTSSPNPSTTGQNVTFTATVAAVPPATGIPTGNVTFVISGGPTLTGTLNAAGQATVSTNTLTTGAHTVTATYGGDTCFAGSTSPTVTQNVVAAPTGTTVTATPATIRLRINGTFVIPTLSATLRDASNTPVPGQNLTFVANSLVGPIALGSAVTNAGGTATLSNVTVPSTAITASTYTASFAGAPGLSPSSGSASLTFQPSPILP
ncbi:beta strand repeat-containing protein [Streptomyces rugosispiralis]|uniref:Ig-like domain repeat protein n=1 Tax=Streptomyces rugosispiralis TaxID=2967341 RepID=A0ABT1UX45_9ACTN|nr:Ig-like domain-containing protein [Streptomyces rugosispiralis]MCQ8189701.1 Ig-like domain repeat protein [Streptomyces rugosispiralis]